MMMGRIGALFAALAAAVGAAAAAVWAWSRKVRGRPEAGAAAARPVRKFESKPKAPAAEPPAAQMPKEGDGTDDLTAIKGIGAVSQERLAGIGVTSFAQIAAWSDDDVDLVATRIKVSAERIRREDWVGQARAIVEA
jgi:large subunit ribosomal protein L21